MATMYFPPLQRGQYAVVKAKLRLGLFADSRGGLWRIFDSLPAARKFATSEVAKQPFLLCGIYDAEGREILSMRS